MTDAKHTLTPWHIATGYTQVKSEINELSKTELELLLESMSMWSNTNICQKLCDMSELEQYKIWGTK